jgi:hypothetical protein
MDLNGNSPLEDKIMTTQHTSSETYERLANFKPQDIKTLVQQNGTATEGNKEFILKEPSPTDPTLQSIVNDPYLEIRSIGNQTKSGEMYFDLKGAGRQVRVKVVCHTQTASL